MATAVPMTHPASVVKNPDGTYSVRVQHTAGGEVTTVNFDSHIFGEIMANGYADILNGKAVVEAGLDKITSDLGPAVSDAKADVKAIIADAEAEAQKLIATAKTEAGKLKTDAESLVASAKSEVVSLEAKAGAALTAAKNEAEKLLNEARAERRQDSWHRSLQGRADRPCDTRNSSGNASFQARCRGRIIHE